MIITRDLDALDGGLQIILEKSAQDINDRSKTNQDLLKLTGTKFEGEVCDSLNRVSLGTSFYKKFEQASTKQFPDLFTRILERQWFGVEVKTSQSDWKCFGNSIFEGTRIQEVEDRIYLFFGKFSDQIDCKWAKYEDCIDKINITHSPRYQINMDIIDNDEESVFQKMNISYNDFYQSDTGERMQYVRRYKRKELGREAALWWLPQREDPDESAEQNLAIRLLSELNQEIKAEIRNNALVLFPSVFSNSPTKYNQVLLWMANNYGVVTGSLRDIFTAGGQRSIFFRGNQYRLPRIFGHVESSASQIRQILRNFSEEDLRYYWEENEQVGLSTVSHKIEKWIQLVELNYNVPNSIVGSWLRNLFR